MQPDLRGFFITGTDTGIGKTIVTAALTGVLHRAGRRVLPVKPVQTGCAPDGRRPAPDIAVCLKLSGLRPPAAIAARLTTYRFRDACSPHLAAARAGRSIRLAGMLADIEFLGRQAEMLLVEGAGGVMVPLNRRNVMLDLMRRLNLPVIVVARTGLGTINHTLLTIAAIRAAGLQTAGLVLCAAVPQHSGYIQRDNRVYIPRAAGLPLLGVLPHISGLPHTAAARSALRVHADRQLPSAARLERLAAANQPDRT